MLTEKQISEIREHLEKAQNPVFYYDNDADGFCSFLLLRRYIGRGYGVVIRSYPDLDAGYARKAEELGADYVFVLDKPVLSKEFVDEIDKMNLPFVWIDHHDVQVKLGEENYESFYAYNPTRNTGKDKSSEPTTYLAHKIAGRKEDEWIAVLGCIADHYMPEFADSFGKENPEFWGSVKEPFDVLYKTELGKIARAIGFGLKDSLSNVVKMQKFMVKASHPSKVLEESEDNKEFREKALELEKKYKSLLEEAESGKKGKSLFFNYGGETSMSADLSNELSYRNKGMYICIAFRKGDIVNLSMRGKGVKKVLEKVLEKVPGSGGGHEDAVGARISGKDLENFEEVFRREVEGL